MSFYDRHFRYGNGWHVLVALTLLGLSLLIPDNIPLKLLRSLLAEI